MVSHDLILAVETSSTRGSIALGAGEQLLGSRELALERRHTTELLPAVRQLLRDAGRAAGDVSVVAVSSGPGSFTGLRVAATLARVWQSAAGCRVVGVPTLEVIARNAPTGPAGRCAAGSSWGVMLDARRGQIYGGLFALNASLALETIRPAGLHALEPWLGSLPAGTAVMGEGLAVHGERVRAAGFAVLPPETWAPRAVEVWRIGRGLADRGVFCQPQEIVPCYLRPPECEEVYEQRRAEARARRGMQNGEFRMQN